MIDWVQVAELRAEIGTDDFEEVAATFIAEMDGVVGRMAEDIEVSEVDMHFVKGAALNLGFAEVSRRAALGEAMARDGRGAAVDRAGLAAAHAASKAALRAGPGRDGLVPPRQTG